MPFGYSNKVFSHPAIEYIPLMLLDSKRIFYPLKQVTNPLFICQNTEALKTLPSSTLPGEFSIYPEQELGIAVMNSEIETIKYRGNYVTIIVHPTPDTHHLCKVLTRYFYKKDLIFQVVDGNGNVSGQRLLSVPIKR